MADNTAQNKLYYDLYINGEPAEKKYGITLDENGLSTLLTPPAMKDNIKSTSRLEHGTKVLQSNAKMQARSISIGINLVAPTRDKFFERYIAFCEVLKTGFVDILTRYQTNVEYHLEYNSCSQFAEYHQGIGKFMLKLTENDPSDRTPRHQYELIGPDIALANMD